MTLSRAQKGGFADWWWTIDRPALFAMLALIAIGLILAFAASPAATGGPFTQGDFRFALKQVAFAGIAAVIMLVSAQLSLGAIKIGSAIVFGLSLLACLFVLFAGKEVLGAKREIDFGWISLQPSEFLKPTFAILAAMVFADKAKLVLRKEIVTFALIVPALIILILQPDDGQTALLLALWGALLFFSGASLLWMGGLAVGGVALAFAAYFLVPHFHDRIAQYNGQGGYQTGLALKAFAHGGWAGVGPGSGTVKYRLPDAHSDFIFAVAGEEFGLWLCGLIALLFAVLSVRLLMRASRLRDPFAQLAGAGLAVVVALQAFINMGVATSLLPAKGMTLPFISYGGSSLFAVALTMGFALSVTRQRPKVAERDVELFGFLREARA
ncbi:MAG TPA: FtsW/RodA/SpoVE family cell cycle protein [Rhizomicrobium sp.]|nr:FtsW/RodA/SpoVE family cell cycle protein [Rhizomicrobium sp.]